MTTETILIMKLARNVNKREENGNISFYDAT